MARLVKELTGPNETGRWGASATDLGFPAITNHGYTITIFGDTFVDAECAAAAGVRFVLHESGYGDTALHGLPRVHAFSRWVELLATPGSE